jgi:hypothetical protein
MICCKLSAQTDPFYDQTGVNDPETDVIGCADTILFTNSCSKDVKRVLKVNNFNPKNNLTYTYSYSIDIDADGSIDKYGPSNVFEGELPAGRHIIYWNIKSSTGQFLKCSSNVFIINQSPPILKLLKTENSVELNPILKKSKIAVENFKDQIDVQSKCCKNSGFELRLVKSQDSDHFTPPIT